MVPAALPLILAQVASGQSVVILDHLDAPAEDAWIQELNLAMGDVLVTRVPPAPFDATPFHEQLDVVRPLLEAEGVEALAWLNEDDSTLHLSVAFVASDRAVVRVVELPSDEDAPARLALATREILTRAIDLPEPAPPAPVRNEPEPRKPSARAQGTFGVTTPVVAQSGGPRPSVDVEVTWPLQPGFALGGSVGAQANGHHWRATPRAIARVGPVVVGAGADIAQLEWVRWVQPRAELGLTLNLPIIIEPRVRFTPLRDQVLDGDVVYDSGWVEFGLHLGIARQISTP